jgi:hypothetical protein
MATTKKAAAKVQKDVRDLRRNLEGLSRKLFEDATHATLNATEKALSAAQKQVQKVRDRLNAAD